MKHENALRGLAVVSLLAAIFDIYIAINLFKTANGISVEGMVHLVRSILEITVFIGVFRKRKWLVKAVVGLFAVGVSHSVIFWILQGKTMQAVIIGVVLSLLANYVIKISREYQATFK